MGERYALLSVWDKTGLVDFARGLWDLGFHLLASGGTAAHLREAGVEVVPAEQLTGFASLLEGRVKTLHPLLHAGILARRDRPEDMAQLESLGAPIIEVVAVNLYPFRETLRKGAPPDEVREMIDIGGPALLRAAAKNFPHVLVVSSPEQYSGVLAALRGVSEPGPDLGFRRRLAAEAFALTMRYDYAVSTYLDGSPSLLAGTQSGGLPAISAGTEGQAPESPPPGSPPPELPPFLYAGWEKERDLRYGENPHQRAALYVSEGVGRAGVGAARILQGKELSYNNILDVHAAWALVSEFPPSQPACVAIKHMGPCGCALGTDLASAYRRARDADPVSIFGGIIGCNVPVDEDTAIEMSNIFLEVVVAPSFTPEGLWHLARKENLRLVEMADFYRPGVEWRQVWGGVLVQESWAKEPDDPAAWQPVTVRRPTSREVEDLLFAWKVVKHVRSNAIVLAHNRCTVGIGQGQPNRVDAARLAIGRAEGRARGAVMASDAFFPFPDVVEEAVRAGITAIVQPGGSLRDKESITACDKAGLAMVFTGVRQFRH